MVLVLVLAACGKTVDEQTDTAIQKARDAFEMNRKKPTESVEGLSFYKPAGWKADVQLNERTFILSKTNQTITAEFDPNAKPDSQAFYELERADEDDETIIQQQTFIDTGVFGFVVIREHSDSTVEVVTGSGSAKVQAIVEKGQLEAMTERMMNIARSVDIDASDNE